MFELKPHLAGSFWSTINKDPIFDHLLKVRTCVEEQAALDIQNLIDCAGRATTPLYRKVILSTFTISSDTQTVHGWPLPANLVSVGMITDKLISEHTTWLYKIDFTIKNGFILFRKDPFTETHQTCALWLHNAHYEENWLSDIWGAILGIPAPSSREYRMLLTIIYDALICGTNQSHIDQITSLFSGVPLALDDSTVVACGTDVKGLFIATETHIYRVPAHSLPVVSTGSELKRGDPLCEIHNPKTPKGLTGIELDKVLQLLGVTAQDTQG